MNSGAISDPSRVTSPRVSGQAPSGTVMATTISSEKLMLGAAPSSRAVVHSAFRSPCVVAAARSRRLLVVPSGVRPSRSKSIESPEGVVGAVDETSD